MASHEELGLAWLGLALYVPVLDIFLSGRQKIFGYNRFLASCLAACDDLIVDGRQLPCICLVWALSFHNQCQMMQSVRCTSKCLQTCECILEFALTRQRTLDTCQALGLLVC